MEKQQFIGKLERHIHEEGFKAFKAVPDSNLIKAMANVMMDLAILKTDRVRIIPVRMIFEGTGCIPHEDFHIVYARGLPEGEPSNPVIIDYISHSSGRAGIYQL